MSSGICFNLETSVKFSRLVMDLRPLVSTLESFQDDKFLYLPNHRQPYNNIGKILAMTSGCSFSFELIDLSRPIVFLKN